MTTKGLNASQTGRTSFLGSRGRIGAPRRCRGFKLVEFVAVLAIASALGITAVSASYGSSGGPRQASSANAQTVLAQTALAEIAAREEQYFLNNKRYTRHLGSKGLGVDSGWPLCASSRSSGRRLPGGVLLYSQRRAAERKGGRWMRYPHTDFRRHQATGWMLVDNVPAGSRAPGDAALRPAAHMGYQQLFGVFTLSESIASAPHLSAVCAPCGVARTR